jgi:hypothetical protein
MQHAAPFSTPSPAHGRCTPETASSKKLVGVAARTPHAPGGTCKQLILAVRPRRVREKLLGNYCCGGCFERCYTGSTP